jgi:mannose-6-phosphate isomerase-like protein (cupin superfamily)
VTRLEEGLAMRDVRRLVTGHDAGGKAIIAMDERIGPAATIAGSKFWQLWQGDSAPTFPDRGSPPPLTTYFPPVGGFRFGIVTFPPGSTENRDVAQRRREMAALDVALPGLFEFHERGGRGMHTTPTIDFEVILEGDLTLELDDGLEAVLSPGDTVVQNGTRHRWINRGPVPATYAVFICGAEHKEVEDCEPTDRGSRG